MTESLAGIEKNWCSLQYIGLPAIIMFSYITVGSKISHPDLQREKKLFIALEILFLSGVLNCVQKRKELKSPTVKLDHSPYSY